jgi:hypothetical protein
MQPLLSLKEVFVEYSARITLAVVLLLVITASSALVAPAYLSVDRNYYPCYHSLIKWEKSQAGFIPSSTKPKASFSSKVM